nr:hypothetical protein GCM10020093_015500 [Planobispora longispora]
MIAADHAPPGERADPLQAGRWGDAQGAGELAVRLPRIRLEKPDDFRIKFIHGGHSALILIIRSADRPMKRSAGYLLPVSPIDVRAGSRCRGQ